MTEIRFGWRGARVRVLAAGLTIVLAPLPLAAAEPAHAAPVISLKAAVDKAAATERLASSTAVAQPEPTAGTAPDSRRFFKTPLGIAVIAVVSAGTAYAVYSAQNDRIHSAAR